MTRSHGLKKIIKKHDVFRTIKVDDEKSLAVDSYVADLYGEFCCLLKYGLKERMYWGFRGSDLDNYDEDIEIVRVSEYFNYKPSEICDDCKKVYNVSKSCKNKCYNKDKKPIQIVYINPEKHETVRSFVKTFDLDFCKIIFDGEKFVPYPALSNSDL